MKKSSLFLAFAAISVFAVGCADSTSDNPEPGSAHHADDGHDHGSDDDHSGHDHGAHDHTPPHGGVLVELGRNHEYHAELVDDHKAGSVTIYIMDSHLEPLSIDQPSVSLVLTAGEVTRTFELTASQTGGSAEFTSNDDELTGMLEGDEATGKIRATIDGKPFSGSFVHSKHDHDDHDHDDHDQKGESGHGDHDH